MPRFIFVLVLAAALAAPAQAHQGNPNYLSRVDATPSGIDVEVLNRDDRLLLRNTSGEDVTIEGYNDEPYARIGADGAVSVNTRSPAYYLNDERFGDVPVPEGIDGKGEPEWKQLDKSGRFEWHDHRMHWMSESMPPQVKDESKRTTVFTWSVPTSAGAIEGTLFWTPQPGAPVGFIVVGSVLTLLLCVAALVVARRRRANAPAEEW